MHAVFASMRVIGMTRLEAIIEETKLLSASEREQLVKVLSDQAAAGQYDAAVGRRGMASMTESSRQEDWSAHYPESLRRRMK